MLFLCLKDSTRYCTESSQEIQKEEVGVVLNDHKKKMIAPVVITVVFLIYLVVYGRFLLAAAEFSPVMFLSAIPLAALGIGMIHVLKERINEIRSGEEDDLSNY